MKKLFIFICILVIAGIGYKVWDANNKPAATQKAAQKTFNKKQYSLDDPTSIWIVTNKQRQLTPKDYAPKDLVTPSIPLRLAGSETEMKLRAEPAKALQEMNTAIKKEANLELMVASAYRPYSFQSGLYNLYVKQQGQASADTQSARPGHSEHQTGLAVDVEPSSKKCEVEECFGETSEGKWVAANAHRFGFIIRYPEGKDDVTGFMYEPWHLRYVGKDLAAQIHTKGTTLEQFFDLPEAPGYK